jgi:hypothetical protein
MSYAGVASLEAAAFQAQARRASTTVHGDDLGAQQQQRQHTMLTTTAALNTVARSSYDSALSDTFDIDASRRMSTASFTSAASAWHDVSAHVTFDSSLSMARRRSSVVMSAAAAAAAARRRSSVGLFWFNTAATRSSLMCNGSPVTLEKVKLSCAFVGL